MGDSFLESILDGSKDIRGITGNARRAARNIHRGLDTDRQQDWGLARKYEFFGTRYNNATAALGPLRETGGGFWGSLFGSKEPMQQQDFGLPPGTVYQLPDGSMGQVPDNSYSRGGIGGFQRQSYNPGYEVPGINGAVGTGVYLGGNGGAQVIRGGGSRNFGRTHGADASGTGNDDLDFLLASLGDTSTMSPRVGRSDRAAIQTDGLDAIAYNLHRNEGGVSSEMAHELRERVSEMPNGEKTRLATSLNNISAMFGKEPIVTMDDEAIAERLGYVAQMQSPNTFRETRSALASAGTFGDLFSDADDKAFEGLVNGAYEADSLLQEMASAQLASAKRTAPAARTASTPTATGFGGADGVLTQGEKGQDAFELQQALKNAGFGNMLGTSGRNKDGIDGDPEKLTFAAARQAGSVMASLGVHDGRTVDGEFIEALKKNAGIIKDTVGKGGLST